MATPPLIWFHSGNWLQDEHQDLFLDFMCSIFCRDLHISRLKPAAEGGMAAGHVGPRRQIVFAFRGRYKETAQILHICSLLLLLPVAKPTGLVVGDSS